MAESPFGGYDQADLHRLQQHQAEKEAAPLIAAERLGDIVELLEKTNEKLDAIKTLLEDGNDASRNRLASHSESVSATVLQLVEQRGPYSTGLRRRRLGQRSRNSTSRRAVGAIRLRVSLLPGDPAN